MNQSAVINGFYHYMATNDTSKLFDAVFKFAANKLRRVDYNFGDAGSCGNRDDLAQDVCIKVWEKFAAFEGTAEEFFALLSKMVYHKRIDAQRQRVADRRREVPFFVEGIDEETGDLVEEENPAIYESAFNDVALEIPESVQGVDREICRWMLDGKSQLEVAERLGMPYGAVRTRVNRLKKRLTLERAQQREQRSKEDAEMKEAATHKLRASQAYTDNVYARLRRVQQDD